MPLREYRTVAGFAFTVKSAPNVKITGEMDIRTTTLSEMQANAFRDVGYQSRHSGHTVGRRHDDGR